MPITQRIGVQSNHQSTFGLIADQEPTSRPPASCSLPSVCPNSSAKAVARKCAARARSSLASLQALPVSIFEREHHVLPQCFRVTSLPRNSCRDRSATASWRRRSTGGLGEAFCLFSPAAVCRCFGPPIGGSRPEKNFLAYYWESVQRLLRLIKQYGVLTMHSKERPKQIGSVLEGIDLSQSASVSWWADVDVPTRGFKWGGCAYDFGETCVALDFVLNRLTKTERGTALIEFASPSSPFDFNDPKVREKLEALRDLLWSIRLLPHETGVRASGPRNALCVRTARGTAEPRSVGPYWPRLPPEQNASGSHRARRILPAGRRAPKGEAAATIAGRGVSRPWVRRHTRLAWPGFVLCGRLVVVPCDHPFGWEALANPSWPGLFI